MRLPFQSDAADELRQAVVYYEQERLGYGRLFLREVMAKVDRATNFPQSGALIPGFDDKYDLRQFVLSRFPYTVVTARLRDSRFVIAVAHQRRRPRYWIERIK